MKEEERETLIYKTLSGAPMLGGLPIHILLVIILGGTLVIFILNIVSGLIGAACAFVMLLIAYGFLNFIYGRDQTTVPLFFLTLRYRFKKKINSYAPSYQKVEITED